MKMRQLMAATGISRAMLGYRAKKLGLRFISRRNWTDYEDTYLENHAGEMPLAKLARMLGRSKDSISCRLRQLAMSARFRRGYSLEELSQCLGANDSTVRMWKRRRWLRTHYGRFMPDNVDRFIAEHIEEISFRRADEQWLKDRLVELIASKPK